MNNPSQEARAILHAEIFAAAKAKLGRDVSSAERAGIECLSLMMLEAIHRAFTFDGYPAEKVESDLRSFAS